MFLSGLFLGVSYFQNVVGIPSPVKKVYDSIQVFGGATIDKLQIENIEIDNETLTNIAISDRLIWNPTTILLAEFENNLIAGNVANLDSPVTKWQISRRESNSSVLKILGIVDVGVTEFVDYLCQANKTYIYEVNALTDTQISEAFVSEETNMSFYGWFLIGNDLDGSTYVYKMDLNVDFGGFQTEEDMTEYSTYIQYNAFAKGNRRFRRGTLTAIAGEIYSNGNSILQSVDYIDELQIRIQDISTKTLKSRKGDILKVKTKGFSVTPLNNGIESQPYIVKFDFIECESV